MKAIIPSTAGGPEVLTLVTRPVPVAGENQVLIRVAFAGVNRHDIGQRTRGKPPAGATDILGLEVSGEIIAVGKGVASARIGERVCALVNGGGYATHCLADADLALPQPELLDEKEAASILEALFTAWFNLINIGGLQKNDWVLLHGGTGAVGTIAIQIAKVLGCKVITTASSQEKCDVCLRLGADITVNYKEQDFVDVVDKATASQGVQVILDVAGASYAERNLHALAMDGCVIHISSGGANYSVPLGNIMAKRARITGSLLRPVPIEKKRELARTLRSRLWAELGHTIRPVIDSVYSLDAVIEAHQRLESRLQIGKILLDARGH